MNPPLFWVGNAALKLPRVTSASRRTLLPGSRVRVAFPAFTSVRCVPLCSRPVQRRLPPFTSASRVVACVTVMFPPFTSSLVGPSMFPAVKLPPFTSAFRAVAVLMVMLPPLTSARISPAMSHRLSEPPLISTFTCCGLKGTVSTAFTVRQSLRRARFRVRALAVAFISSCPSWLAFRVGSVTLLSCTTLSTYPSISRSRFRPGVSPP